MNPELKALLDKYAAAGASDDELRQVAADWTAKNAAAAPMTQLLKEQNIIQGPGTIHERYKSGELQRHNAAMTAQDVAAQNAPPDASTTQKALGGVASFIRGMPIVPAVAAGARSLIRGQPYSEAASDITNSENASGPIGRANEVLGSGLALAAAPALLPKLGMAAGGALRTGTQYGLLRNLTAPEQFTSNAPLRSRLAPALLEGAETGLGNKLAQVATTGARAAGQATAGTTDEALRAARSEAASPLYRQAEAEAAAGGGTSPEIQQALAHPRVAPLADDVRSSFQLQGLPDDDASVLMQIHRELSSKQGPLIQQLTGASDWKALTNRQIGDIAAIKDALREAASGGQNPLMPSFRPATQEFAAQSEPVEAFETMKDAANRLATNPIIKGRKLAKQSAEAVSGDIADMGRPQALAGRSGAATAASEQFHLNPYPWYGFGVPGSLVRTGRLAPMIDQLSQQANLGTFQHGLSAEELIRALATRAMMDKLQGGRP